LDWLRWGAAFRGEFGGHVLRDIGRPVGVGDKKAGRGGIRAVARKIFTIRMDAPWATTSTWVKCPLEGGYRYESMVETPPPVVLRSAQDAAQFLPHGYQYLLDVLAEGGRYESAM